MRLITFDITLQSSKRVKKNATCLKLFWYKDFVHWKLKLLNFLMDSALILLGNNGIRVMKKRLVSVKQGSKMSNFGTPLPKFSFSVPPGCNAS